MRNNDALYVVMGSSVAQIDQLRIIFWKSRELESEREKNISIHLDIVLTMNLRETTRRVKYANTLEI